MKPNCLNILFLFLVFQFSDAQNSIPEILEKYNNQSIPYISVDSVALSNSEIFILDARELKEFKVSHLKKAIHVGYDNFNIDYVKTKIPSKDSKIIVYCSLGIRSEDIAEKIKKAGYKNVSNLYGGIFEWINNDFKIYNSEEKETDSVHTFRKTLGKWLVKGTKVYD